MAKNCTECGRSILGRIDKKYCNDQCRADFHNRSNSVNQKRLRNVNRTIWTNRMVLAEICGTKRRIIATMEDLMDRGFRPGWCTRVQENDHHVRVQHCYDYFWYWNHSESKVVVECASNINVT